MKKSKLISVCVPADTLFDTTYKSMSEYSTACLLNMYGILGLIIDIRKGDKDYVHVMESLKGKKMVYDLHKKESI